MRLVSETSEQDLAINEALADLEWPLRELAANMLRVVRGAGYPSRLASQMTAVLNAMRDYHAVAGFYPSSDHIADVLSLTRREHSDDLQDAVDKMIGGALQMVASDLVNQRTQESRGRTELFEGLMEAETIRAASRRTGRLGRGRGGQDVFKARLNEKLDQYKAVELD